MSKLSWLHFSNSYLYALRLGGSCGVSVAERDCTNPPGRSERRSAALLAAVLLARAAQASAPAIEPADLVFREGAILTFDATMPDAEAVAVRAGRIVFAGRASGVSAYVGARTQVVDLGQRLLMPAFHDAHMHPMSGGMRLLRCTVEGVATAQGVVDAVGACARQRPSSPWLIVTGLAEALASAPALDRRVLDRLAPDRPLAIAIGPGFSLRVNSRALSLAGLDEAAADPARGDIERDRTTGAATGLVSGDAMQAVRHAWPRPTIDEYREALRKATAMANRAGIVSVLDASVDADMLRAYRAADAAGELTVRVVAAQRIVPESGLAQVDAMRAARDAIHSAHLRADVAKIFVDGEIELHTAALLQPYLDSPEERGQPIDADRFDALVDRLDHEGFDVHMHVMGDRAVRTGLDALAHAAAANGVRDRRDQLAHDQLIDPADLSRFAALGVIANVQPAWAWHDPVNEDAERRLGAARARMLVPIRSLFDAGARVVASSDWPSPVMDPLAAIQIGVTRRPLDGSTPSWHPEQRATLMQMLRAYTVDAAWVLRRERESGSIAIGKAADLIVLDRDVRRVDPMALHDVRVLLTLLDGKAVYRDPAFEEASPAGRMSH
jgi:predicted amidohydrolase YtcJ